MTPNLISANAIIATVAMNFDLAGTTWIPLAYEWLGYGLQAIGGRPHLERVKWSTKSKNHKVVFPCNLTHILYIEYKCKPLQLSLQNRHMSFNLGSSRSGEVFATEFPTLYESSEITGVSVAGTYDVKNISSSAKGEWYYLNNGTIITSFASDDLIVYYEGFALDEKGFPLIPDSFEHIEALSFFILYKYLSRGNTHPVWKVMDAYQMWEKYRIQATGRALTPSPAELAAFTNAWARLVTDHFTDSKFRHDMGNMQTVFGV